MLQHVERSDLGCGRGGGKNNADVFDRVGLMFITNANAKTSSAGTCSFVKLQSVSCHIKTSHKSTGSFSETLPNVLSFFEGGVCTDLVRPKRSVDLAQKFEKNGMFASISCLKTVQYNTLLP